MSSPTSTPPTKTAKKSITTGSPLHPALEDRLGYLLAHNHLAIRELAEQALEPIGLLDAECTPKHVGTLILIAEEGPLSQHRLGELMHVDRTTMVAIVDALEDAGYVERRRNPLDRRAYALEITKAGRRWLEPAHRALLDAEHSYLEPLTRDERRSLRHLLQKLLTEQPV